MSGFSAQWLDLREPLDSRSRSTCLYADLIRLRASEAPTILGIIDLGAGTGANLRHLAPHLGGAQDWRLVENDPTLVGSIEERMRAWAPDVIATDQSLIIRSAAFECHARPLVLDLAAQLDELPIADKCLVTASALLDLVSTDWLQQLVVRVAQAQASVLFALTYDGRMECVPPEGADAEVQSLVNRHQIGDKGFGVAALGPQAAPAAIEMFQNLGYRVRSATSDWHIGPDEQAVQLALIAGWFAAACEIAPYRASVLDRWLALRRGHIAAGRSHLSVGHVDILGTCVSP